MWPMERQLRERDENCDLLFFALEMALLLWEEKSRGEGSITGGFEGRHFGTLGSAFMLRPAKFQTDEGEEQEVHMDCEDLTQTSSRLTPWQGSAEIQHEKAPVEHIHTTSLLTSLTPTALALGNCNVAKLSNPRSSDSHALISAFLYTSAFCPLVIRAISPSDAHSSTANSTRYRDKMAASTATTSTSAKRRPRHALAPSEKGIYAPCGGVKSFVSPGCVAGSWAS